MYKYTKIETIFNRDKNGNKKLIEGEFCNETVEYLKDNEWEFTEKIDGTNIGILWDGHGISYQGRTERTQLESYITDRLDEMFSGVENEEIFEQLFGENVVVLFGEGYGGKIRKGKNYYREDVSFILFDVYMPEKNLWLKRDAIEDIAKSFGIDAVPVVLRGTLQQGVDFVKSRPISTIGKAQMEGIVGKPRVNLLDRMGRRCIVKIKCCDFAIE